MSLGGEKGERHTWASRVVGEEVQDEIASVPRRRKANLRPSAAGGNGDVLLVELWCRWHIVADDVAPRLLVLKPVEELNVARSGCGGVKRKEGGRSADHKEIRREGEYEALLTWVADTED